MPTPLLAAAISLYLALGSMSIGYLLLRTGWPKVRILQKSYKLGWSIVLGGLFSVFAIISSFAISLGGLSYEGLLFASSGIFLGIASLALTVRRKFFAGARMRVAVPKEVVGANIAATKVEEMFRAREDYLNMDTMEEGRRQVVVDKLRSLIRKRPAREDADKEAVFERAVPAGAAEEESYEEDREGDLEGEEEIFGKRQGGVKPIAEEDLDGEDRKNTVEEEEIAVGEEANPLGKGEQIAEEPHEPSAPVEIGKGKADEKASILSELEKKLAAAQEKEAEEERDAKEPAGTDAEGAPEGKEKKKPAAEKKKEPAKKGGGIFAMFGGLVPKWKPKAEDKKKPGPAPVAKPGKEEITDEETTKKLSERIREKVSAAQGNKRKEPAEPASWAAEAPKVGEAKNTKGAPEGGEAPEERKDKVDKLKKLLRGIK